MHLTSTLCVELTDNYLQCDTDLLLSDILRLPLIETFTFQQVICREVLK